MVTTPWSAQAAATGPRGTTYSAIVQPATPHVQGYAQKWKKRTSSDHARSSVPDQNAEPTPALKVQKPDAPQTYIFLALGHMGAPPLTSQ